jgi:AcrR family transcriptional regulator
MGTVAAPVESQLADGRRRRGDASRRAILARAIQLASLDGLNGLTIGRLAVDLNVSKSGVVALFGSKAALQMAAIEAACDVYVATVIRPVLDAPRGLCRLWRLCDLWLEYSENRVFEGGCFFRAVSAEVDSRDGPVHDALVRIDESWKEFVQQAIREAADQLPGLDDFELLSFELISVMDGANTASLLHRSSRPYELARTSIRRRLQGLGGNLPPE